MRQEEFEFVKRYQTAVEVSAIVDALEHKKTPEEVRAWFKDIPVELRSSVLFALALRFLRRFD